MKQNYGATSKHDLPTCRHDDDDDDDDDDHDDDDDDDDYYYYYIFIFLTQKMRSIIFWMLYKHKMRGMCQVIITINTFWR